MTTGPTEGKCANPAGGPDGMPLALRFSEGLGPAEPERDVAVLIEYLRHLSLPGTPGDQAADALAEQTREIELLRGAIAASDERLQKAAERAGLTWFGCDTASNLADTIDELRQPWQPIETAPRNSKPVLVFEPGHTGGVFKAHLARMLNKQEQWITRGTLHKLRPTHWMQMPAGPNVRAKLAPAAGRQARAGENGRSTTGPGLVACRWCSA